MRRRGQNKVLAPSLSKKGLSGFITRQATKLMRDKMYE